MLQSKLDRGGRYFEWSLTADSGVAVEAYPLHYFRVQATGACTLQGSIDGGTTWFDIQVFSAAGAATFDGPVTHLRANGTTNGVVCKVLGVPWT